MLQKHPNTEGFPLKNGIYVPKNLSVAIWVILKFGRPSVA